MIRIDISREQLLAAIEAESPGWLADAKQRTRLAKQAGGVAGEDGTWSKIKAIYIRLQAHKCIYCETPMAKTVSGSAEKVKVDYDVEHFRPKNRVTHWPTDTDLARRPKLDYADRIVDGLADGYVRFAFGPFVYSKRKRGPEHLRARVVIDFFELDTRENLLEARCCMLVMLFPQLRERDRGSSAAKRQAAAAFVDTIYETRFPHAACARSFVELYEANPHEAEQLYDAARQYYMSKDPTVLAAISPAG